MNERIKKLRKALDLTQQEFGDRIGIKRNTLANYEIGRNEPIDAVISLICREFNVSEAWLRTGEGEMFVESDDTILSQLAREYQMDSFETAMVSNFLKLKPEQREAIKQYVKSLLDEVEGKTVPSPVPTPPPAEPKPPERVPDLAAEIAQVKRQNEEMAARIAAMEEEDARGAELNTPEPAPQNVTRSR